MDNVVNIVTWLWQDGIITGLAVFGLGWYIYDLKKSHKKIPEFVQYVYQVVKELDNTTMINSDKKIKAMENITNILKTNSILKHYSDKDISDVIDKTVDALHHNSITNNTENTQNTQGDINE